MSMPESVLSYLDLLIRTYSGEVTPKPPEVATAWEAVPLNWRMRVHEQCDFEAHEDILAGAHKMLLASVQEWDMESPDTHTGPVPKMPRVEREAWHRLSNKRLQSQAGGPRLTLAEGKLLFALDRKIKARAAREAA